MTISGCNTFHSLFKTRKISVVQWESPPPSMSTCIDTGITHLMNAARVPPSIFDQWEGLGMKPQSLVPACSYHGYCWGCFGVMVIMGLYESKL